MHARRRPGFIDDILHRVGARWIQEHYTYDFDQETFSYCGPISRWREEHPELVPQLERAREQTRQDALASINKAGETDWRAKKAFLELSYQEYRQPNTKIEAPEEVTVVCTPEQRRAMIKAREAFLTEGPKSQPLPDQPKLQPGHIGATRAPGDKNELASEQIIVQPGQSFTPNFEPYGLMEAAL